MSLATALRGYLTSLPDFASNFPGNMQPDVAAPETPMPYIVYAISNSEPSGGVDGNIDCFFENLTLSIFAATKIQAEARAKWVYDQIGPGTWAGSTPKALYWRRGAMTDAAEIELEGSDDSVRVASLNVVGAYIPS
jgi:hypothetical protein